MAAASPDLASWKAEFGDKVKVNEQTGEFSIKLTDRQEIRRAHEMQEATRRIEVERGDELHAKHEGKREKVVRRDGKVVEVPHELIDMSKKTGFRPVGRNGVSGRLFFGMSGATAKYVKGMDELDFIWNDGWEPAPLFSRNVEGQQRDPDGNVWVKKNGDWELLNEEV
jgi:hypothetical protein